jgi:hypothetical protein
MVVPAEAVKALDLVTFVTQYKRSVTAVNRRRAVDGGLHEEYGASHA